MLLWIFDSISLGLRYFPLGLGAPVHPKTVDIFTSVFDKTTNCGPIGLFFEYHTHMVLHLFRACDPIIVFRGARDPLNIPMSPNEDSQF